MVALTSDRDFYVNVLFSVTRHVGLFLSEQPSFMGSSLSEITERTHSDPSCQEGRKEYSTSRTLSDDHWVHPLLLRMSVFSRYDEHFIFREHIKGRRWVFQSNSFDCTSPRQTLILICTFFYYNSKIFQPSSEVKRNADFKQNL